MTRLYLSPPHLTGDEARLVADALASNWVAPVGPHVDAFEREIATVTGVPHAAAVSSGTAALHLAMRLLGVGPDDEVLCASFTFIASANPIVYERARPVFVDCDASWTIDPGLVEDELVRAARRGRLPRAVIAVDLYGQTANYLELEAICERYGVALVADAAESLGASCGGRPAGAFGKLAAISFNGNKVITTSAGGMLLSHDGELIARARFLSTQAREPAAHYEHNTVAYNYRLSNVLAAIGRGQLRTLGERVAARRSTFEAYRRELGDLPGVGFMAEAPWGISSRWLTCLEIEAQQFGATRDEVERLLLARDIECRPVWKPMHLQPVFRGARVLGGEVCAGLFARGLCLPSGSGLTVDDRERVVTAVREACRG